MNNKIFFKKKGHTKKLKGVNLLENNLRLTGEEILEGYDYVLLIDPKLVHQTTFEASFTVIDVKKSRWVSYPSAYSGAKTITYLSTDGWCLIADWRHETLSMHMHKAMTDNGHEDLNEYVTSQSNMLKLLAEGVVLFREYFKQPEDSFDYESIAG